MASISTQQILARVEADRKAAGVTVAALSKATGIPRTTLSRYLAGRTEFTVSGLMRVSEHLNIPFAAWTSGANGGRS